MPEEQVVAKKPKSKRHFTLMFWLKSLGTNFLSIIPIVVLVSVLFFSGILPDFNTSNSSQVYVGFLICAVMIGVGLTLFITGTEKSMSEIGTVIGHTLFKRRSLPLILFLTALLGFLVTIAEPDLKVTASQIGFDETMFTIMVGLGVALFLVFGVLRIIFNKGLNIMFIAFYCIVFMLAGIVNPKFLPICFDSGGVTTGPVTVPFILAFGAGLAASKSNGKTGSADSFGLTALASVGPIIMVMIMGLFIDFDSIQYHWETPTLETVKTWEEFWPTLGNGLAVGFKEQLLSVLLAIVPIGAFFIIYELIFVKLPVKTLLKIGVGLIYFYVGLVLFMTAVDLGFLPVAQMVGVAFAHETKYVWLAILVGGFFGFSGTLAEPAVHVLVKQIEDVSEGRIKANTVLLVMAVAIGGGVALAVTRSYFEFSILYYMVPGYMIALGLTFIVPPIYTAMAFDSGGVASGPMASTFVMPFVVGFSYGLFGADSVFEFAFGCVAMIALMPLIVIQLMGLISEMKKKLTLLAAKKAFIEPGDNQVIHFAEE